MEAYGEATCEVSSEDAKVGDGVKGGIQQQQRKLVSNKAQRIGRMLVCMMSMEVARKIVYCCNSIPSSAKGTGGGWTYIASMC